MLNLLDRMFLNAKNRWNGFVAEFKENEMGVSNFVATIVLILIVVLLCALLYTYLGGWFTDMWARITGATDPIK